MSNTIVSVDQLSQAIEAELESYNRAILDEIKEETKKHMDRLVKETKDTAPVGKRRKHYKDSITSRKEFETVMGAEYIWYVKGPDYRLSHLLENGHALRNGGRTQGTHFIRIASERVIESYIQAVEEVCRNG